jgi:1-acyl-sn-glycerol-3-phosphate acyltransferase
VPPPLIRRLISVPVVLFGTIVLTLAFPVLVVVTLLIDMVLNPRRVRITRAYAFLVWMGWIELVTLVKGLLIGARYVGRLDDPKAQHRLQRVVGFYGHHILNATSKVLGLKLDATGIEAVADGAPMVCFGHHTSILDSVVPVDLLGYRSNYDVHYVIKKELAWGPAFDIVGHWVRVHFVDRTGRDSAAEMEAVAALAHELGPWQMPVIYPEGTFYNAKRLANAVERLKDQAPDLVARAERLRHVLPPRTGGATALLDAAPDLDVLFVVHSGFEKFTSIARIFRNIPFRQPVHVHLWRVASRDVPRDPEERYRWLFTQFERMDAWVTEQLEPELARAA